MLPGRMRDSWYDVGSDEVVSLVMNVEVVSDSVVGLMEPEDGYIVTVVFVELGGLKEPEGEGGSVEVVSGW